MKKMLAMLLCMTLWASCAMAETINSCSGGCNGHTFTGTEKISVQSGTHYITLSGVDINGAGVSGGNSSAFSIEPGAKVFLTLEGRNVLAGGENYAGLRVPAGAELEITAQSTGSLEATGNAGYTSKGGAGIGGNNGESGGTITIHGGTVTATGGSGGAGIGGGGWERNGGKVTITGGFVTANGGLGGAGIGGGESGIGGDVVITGGTVEATAQPDGKNPKAIGSGGGKKQAGTLTVSGEVIEMRGGESKNAAAPVKNAQALQSGGYHYAFIRVSKAGPAADLPKTGDPSMLGAWVTLLGASAMGLRLKKKKS